MSMRSTSSSVRFAVVLLAIAALGGPGAAVAAQIPFGPQRIISTSEGFAIDVVAGDLDRDGDPDLVGDETSFPALGEALRVGCDLQVR